MHNYDKLFNKNYVIEYKLKFPCKKNYFLTELRKICDTKNQYIQHIHYIDTLSFSYDNTEIYSSYNDEEDYSPVT